MALAVCTVSQNGTGSLRSVPGVYGATGTLLLNVIQERLLFCNLVTLTSPMIWSVANEYVMEDSFG